jgi:glycosyl hydrolase family 16
MRSLFSSAREAVRLRPAVSVVCSLVVLVAAVSAAGLRASSTASVSSQPAGCPTTGAGTGGGASTGAGTSTDAGTGSSESGGGTGAGSGSVSGEGTEASGGSESGSDESGTGSESSGDSEASGGSESGAGDEADAGSDSGGDEADAGSDSGGVEADAGAESDGDDEGDAGAADALRGKAAQGDPGDQTGSDGGSGKVIEIVIQITVETGGDDVDVQVDSPSTGSSGDGVDVVVDEPSTGPSTGGGAGDGTGGGADVETSDPASDDGEPCPEQAAPGSADDGPTAADAFGWGTPVPEASDEFNYGSDAEPAPPDEAIWNLPGEGPDGCFAGHAGNGQRCGTHTKVHGGFLRLTSDAEGNTGWLAAKHAAQYGRWEVRARSEATGEGEPYHPVLILWPDSDQWPQGGEYDFLENTAPGEDCAGSFIHYPHEEGPVQQEYAEQCGVDLTQWHNFAVEWTPDHIAGFIDGEEWFRWSGGEGEGRQCIQCAELMHQTIQLDNFDSTQPAVFEVDWTRHYTLDGGDTDGTTQTEPGEGDGGGGTGGTGGEGGTTVSPASTGSADPVDGFGRIALAADGNLPDVDDFGGTAMALAMLAHEGLQPNVVNYTYNNYIWDSDPEMRATMTETALDGAERFGFDRSAFFDAADPEGLDAGVADLVADINASTADDELTLVLMGPMETAWMALDQADPEARRHVRCVSHGVGTFNQTEGADHGGHTYQDVLDLGCQHVQIPDQNGGVGRADMGPWEFLLEMGDPDMEWLHERIELGEGSIADAGMVFFVITGMDAANRDDVRTFLTGPRGAMANPGAEGTIDDLGGGPGSEGGEG